MAKKIDIFDLLPEEANKQVDEIGYGFLKENGYDVEGAIESKEKQAEIKKALAKDGKRLTYFSMIDKDTKAILIWFELYQGKERIATSKGIKFLPLEGGQNGERENQERPSDASQDNA